MYSTVSYIGRFFPSRRKMPQRIKALMIISIALSQLALSSFSYAASRVFFDDFESGTTKAWNDATCSVVNRAPDGGSPHSGSYMLQCNWNGVVPWNDRNNKTYAVLDSWPYNNEFFLRLWVRYDQDVDHKAGSKLFRLGFDGPDEIIVTCQMEQGNAATLWIGVSGQSSFWGNSQAVCGDHRWHKLEMYIKNDTNGTDGTIRAWVDGALVKEWANTKTHTPGVKRTPFNLISNWSSNPGWEHDASNHVFIDDVEIFSDVGSGASGSMVAGTTAASGTATVSKVRPPKNLQVQ